jgi:hypothetical protein
VGDLCHHAWIPFDLIDRMKKKQPSKDEGGHGPYRIRLPGFVAGKEVGLGDVIKRATSAVGIRPCVGCERRAAALNRWFVFTGRHSR